jgi:uncharacterized protein (TIRG00374 family)
MRPGQWKWLALSVGFSLAVLIGLVYFTVDETTVAYLLRAHPAFLFLAVVLYTGAIAIWALRIRAMAAHLGYPVGFRHSFKLVCANLLMAAITPSKAGGEPVRIHQLYRAGVPVGDATAIVILERLLDGVVLGLMGAVSILLLVFRLSRLNLEHIGNSILLALLFLSALLLFFVGLFVYSVHHPDLLKRFLRRTSRWFTRRWDECRVDSFVTKMNREVDNFNRSLTDFVQRGLHGLAWAGLLTGLYWIAEFGVASLVLMSLGQPPFLIESFIIQLVLAILLIVPLTPGGSGIAELGAASLYSLLIPSAIVGIFVFLWRMIGFYYNIIVGLLASTRIVHQEFTLQIDEPEECAGQPESGH